MRISESQAPEGACDLPLQNVRAIYLKVVSRHTATLKFYRELGFNDCDHDLMTLRLPDHP